MIKRIIAAVLTLSTLGSSALAQSSPGLVYGQVPTAAQWNSYFAGKQNTLGYVPLNKAGDTMLGELVTAAPSASRSGLNLPPGTAPTAPSNGDLWTTTGGLYVRIAGTTLGPLVPATSGSFAATAPLAVTFPSSVVTYALNFNASLVKDGSNNLGINLAHGNTFTAAQAINLNSGTPTSLSDSILTLSAPDSTAVRVQINAYGALAHFTGAVYGGTAAAPTAITLNTQLTGINAYAYNGAALVGPIVSFRTYAAENIASGHQGSYACIATTPTSSTTLANGICQQHDGGITIASPTGSSKGSGTINVAGGYYVNGGPVSPTSAGLAGTLLQGNGVTTAPTFTATPVLGINATTAGTLGLANGGGGGATVTVQNLGATAGYNFNLPTTAGSSGQIMQSGGGASASMTWSTATYPVTATATGTILRADGTNWTATTASYPNTAAIGSILNATSLNGIAATITPVLGDPTAHTVGTLGFANATSGTVTLQAVAGALGSAVLSLPAITDTLAGKALANGGTNASLTASNGGIVYSNASAFAILAGTATANQMLMSGSSTTPAWSTNTYPSTALAGTIMAAATANTVTASATPTLGASGTIGTISFGNATSGTVTLGAVAGALGTVTASLPANTGTVAETNYAQTWSAFQSFNSGNLVLNGASSGATTLNANSASGTVIATLPANTGIIAELNYAQSWTAPQTYQTILAGTTNTYDIGTSATISAFRTVYAGTSFVGPTGTFTTSVGTPTITLGTQQTTQGALVLANTAAGAFSTTVKSSNTASAAWTLTLPVTAGISGYALTTDGAGTSAWTSLATGITLTANSTPTSGFSAGNVLMSDGAKIQVGTNINATSLALGGATIGTNALAVTGTTMITSASASALAVGLNGVTNPAFVVNASTALQAAGLSVTGAATGGTVAVAAIDSGSNTNLTINAKGTGTIGIGSVSTGAVTITPATTLSAALTYGGVALSNSVTGTGSMVLSAGPTLTGHPTVEGVTSTGATGTGKFVFDTAPSMSSLTVTTAFTATGLVTNADLANPATTVNGQTCTLGSTCTITASAGTITSGVTTVASSTDKYVLYNNAGTLGSYSVTGTAGSVVLSTAPTIAGGSITGLTAFAVRDTSAAFDVTFAATSSAALTADRALTLNVGNVAHTLALGTTANTITFPNLSSFTVITSGDTGSVTSTILANSLSLVTPNVNVATGTSLALGGGSIGSDALEVTGTTTHNGNVTFASASIIISGNISAAAWTTNGLRIKGTPGTLTDTSSSGTVATAYTDVLGGNAIAASSATTFTNYVTQYVKDPVQGSNVTLTNKWAIGGDSLRIGTSNQLTVSNAGALGVNATATFADSGTWGSGGINAAIIGGTTKAAGSFTTLVATGNVQFTGISGGTIAFALCTDSSGNLVPNSSANCYAGGSAAAAGSTSQVQYNSGGSLAANGGFVYDGTSKITLGVAGASVGGVVLQNASSGSITINPPTGALGTVTITVPAVTDTLAVLGTAQTFTAQQTYNIASTFASATAATLRDVYVQASTTTITGNTGSPITALNKVYIGQPTLTDSSAVTVTNAASIYVDNAPLAAGSVTLTNTWAIRVGAGNVSFPGTGNALGTITSGTWNGTAVAGQYGGTGVANTGKTITLGASITTTGAGTPTLAFSGTGRTYTFQDAALTVAALDITGQTMSGGVHLTAYSYTTGSITIDCGLNPIQYVTGKTSAWSITAPAADSSCLLLVTNPGSSVNIPTFSGFTVGANTGDAFDTTASNKFTVSIWRIAGVSSYVVKALQ